MEINITFVVSTIIVIGILFAFRYMSIKQHNKPETHA